MNIIFVGKHHGKSRTLRLDNTRLVLAMVLVLAALSSLFVAGYYAGSGKQASHEELGILSPESVKVWRNALLQQRQQLDELDQLSRERFDALTLRMGNMHARLLRLDALGQRLTDVAKLKNGEFDFSTQPAVGGPIEAQEGQSFTELELKDALSRIEQQLVNREQQLELIEQLFANRTIQKELFIAGRPISWGGMSSPYGYRSDPFSSKRAWHAGVDFAGKEASELLETRSRRWLSSRPTPLPAGPTVPTHPRG